MGDKSYSTWCVLVHAFGQTMTVSNWVKLLLLSSAGFVLFTLGLVIFIPGFYYSRIAYYAYKGHPGFTFDVIPAV